MAKDEEEWYGPGKLFTGTRSLHVLGIALVAGLYAFITKDTRPLAVFVMAMAAIFLFDLVNFLLGKIHS